MADQACTEATFFLKQNVKEQNVKEQPRREATFFLKTKRKEKQIAIYPLRTFIATHHSPNTNTAIAQPLPEIGGLGGGRAARPAAPPRQAVASTQHHGTRGQTPRGRSSSFALCRQTR